MVFFASVLVQHNFKRSYCNRNYILVYPKKQVTSFDLMPFCNTPPFLRLGPGVSIRFCGQQRLLCSVPEELSGDTAQVLEMATASGGKICAAELERWASDGLETSIFLIIFVGW